MICDFHRSFRFIDFVQFLRKLAPHQQVVWRWWRWQKRHQNWCLRTWAKKLVLHQSFAIGATPDPSLSICHHSRAGSPLAWIKDPAKPLGFLWVKDTGFLVLDRLVTKGLKFISFHPRISILVSGWIWTQIRSGPNERRKDKFITLDLGTSSEKKRD